MNVPKPVWTLEPFSVKAFTTVTRHSCVVWWRHIQVGYPFHRLIRHCCAIFTKVSTTLYVTYKGISSIVNCRNQNFKAYNLSIGIITWIILVSCYVFIVMFSFKTLMGATRHIEYYDKTNRTKEVNECDHECLIHILLCLVILKWYSNLNSNLTVTLLCGHCVMPYILTFTWFYVPE